MTFMESRIDRIRNAVDPRAEVVATYDEIATRLSVGALYAVTGIVLSLRHGTAEITAGYWRLAGIMGAVAAAAAVMRNRLKQ